MKAILATLILLFGFNFTAQAMQCSSLFDPAQTAYPKAIEINIQKKSVTDKYFYNLKEKSIDKKTYKEVREALSVISKSGVRKLTTGQIEVIVDFRQDISFLRSAYEVLAKKHKSPKEFNEFVKTFGKLKDLVLMREEKKSAKIAKEILEDVSFKDLEAMTKDEDLANKSSIKAYIYEKIAVLDYFLYKNEYSIDGVHTMRKALRNIYRYLEIQKKVVDMNSQQKELFKSQLEYLKELNKDLGIICDKNATEILSGQTTKESYYQLPTDLFIRIDYFLKQVKIVEKEVK